MPSILLIEDNPQSARLVAKILQRSDYAVRVATTGEEGLLAAMQEKPDLMLIDLGLPDIDGQTLVAILRQQSDLAGVPLIAFTAWPPDAARQMAKAYGCDGVISKPVERASLLAAVETFLSSGSAAPS